MRKIFKAIILAAFISLTHSMNAQTAIIEDDNTIRVETTGGYFYVDATGKYDGPYSNTIVYPDGSIVTITGFRRGSLNIGKRIVKYNGKVVRVSTFNRDGILVKSVRIRPHAYSGNLCQR